MLKLRPHFSGGLVSLSHLCRRLRLSLPASHPCCALVCPPRLNYLLAYLGHFVRGHSPETHGAQPLHSHMCSGPSLPFPLRSLHFPFRSLRSPFTVLTFPLRSLRSLYGLSAAFTVLTLSFRFPRSLPPRKPRTHLGPCAYVHILSSSFISC